LMKHGAVDPLKITSQEATMFLSAAAYWIARGCVDADSTGYLQYLPQAIHVAGALAAAAPFIMSKNKPWKQAATTIGLATLEMLPVTGIITQAYRTANVAYSAFNAIKDAKEYFAENPLQALSKVAVNVVNTSHSLYMLGNVCAENYEASQKAKEETRTIVTEEDVECRDLLRNGNLSSKGDVDGYLRDLIKISKDPQGNLRLYEAGNYKKLNKKLSIILHPDHGGTDTEIGKYNQAMEYTMKNCKATATLLEVKGTQYTCPTRVWYDPRTAFCFDYVVRANVTTQN